MQMIHGDLIQLARQGQFDVIVHGCNCFCTMGAGFAKQVKETFPEAYAADCRTYSGDTGKLGTFTFAEVPLRFADEHKDSSDLQQHWRTRKLTIVNAYTQFNYGRVGLYVNYGAVASVFKEVKKKFSGKKIAYPKIGAGYAGGNWELIAKLIDHALEGEDHTLVVI